MLHRRDHIVAGVGQGVVDQRRGQLSGEPCQRVLFRAREIWVGHRRLPVAPS